MSTSLLDPEVSRKLAECVNTKTYLDLPDTIRTQFENAYLTGKTLDDLPQEVLKIIGFFDKKETKYK